MIKSWIARFRRAPAQPPLAPERPFYAVGDLHGRLDLLDRMLSLIAQDAAEHGVEDAVTVFLGDYVDRGPESAGVLARLRGRMAQYPDNTRALKGNHEAMMLAWLDDPTGHRSWLRHGGTETLLSYGVSPLTETSPPDDLHEGADALRRAFPDGEEAWLRALPLIWRSGNMVCVHAGTDPDLPIDNQLDGVLIWGHANSHKKPRRDGHHVVHGHTISREPEVAASRIGIDTGAYFSDRLTACRVTPTGGLNFLTATA